MGTLGLKVPREEYIRREMKIPRETKLRETLLQQQRSIEKKEQGKELDARQAQTLHVRARLSHRREEKQSLEECLAVIPEVVEARINSGLLKDPKNLLRSLI